MYPVLLKIGSFELESYFTIITFALIVGLLYAIKRASPLLKESTSFYDFLIVLILSAYIGARIFHILFERPEIYINNPLEIFKVWKGGFVLHGSLFFALISGALFIKYKKLPALQIADIVSSPLMATLAIGRLACFMTGCCYGKPTSSIFGVIFPENSAAPSGIPLHPTQLYMSFSALLVFIILLIAEKFLKPFSLRGLSFAIVLMLYPAGRFFIEFLRDDFRGGELLGLSVSQISSLILVAAGTGLFVYLLKRMKH